MSFIRVRDEESGHELTVVDTPTNRVGVVVLDEPATTRNGLPLPPKHGKPSKKKPVAPKETQPGHQADTTEEN